jgi:hypothetical protein
MFYCKTLWFVSEVTTWNQVKNKPAESRMRRVAHTWDVVFSFFCFLQCYGTC